jgi:hypothetical protein
MIFIKDKIEKILLSTKLNIISENQIKNNYPNITSINYLLIIDDYYIAIQHIYNKPNINDVDKFITNIQQLSNILQKQIIGIYLSYSDLSHNAKYAFNNINKSKTNIKCVSIYDNNQENLINKLIKYLYTHKIYIYYNDNSSYMINTELDL